MRPCDLLEESLLDSLHKHTMDMHKTQPGKLPGLLKFEYEKGRLKLQENLELQFQPLSSRTRSFLQFSKGTCKACWLGGSTHAAPKSGSGERAAAGWPASSLCLAPSTWLNKAASPHRAQHHAATPARAQEQHTHTDTALRANNTPAALLPGMAQPSLAWHSPPCVALQRSRSFPGPEASLRPLPPNAQTLPCHASHTRGT